MCLYDWIQYSTKRPKRKRARKGKEAGPGISHEDFVDDAESTYLPFENGHPQTKSHEGLIDNLNLKYECMDAKDNLKSQHKKKYRAALGLPAGEDDDFDDFDEYDDGLDEAINADGSIVDNELLGKRRVNRLNQMHQAQSIVAPTGWLDEVHAITPLAASQESMDGVDMHTEIGPLPYELGPCSDPSAQTPKAGVVREPLPSSVQENIETYMTPASWKQIVKRTLPRKPKKGRKRTLDIPTSPPLLY
ncbi:hypothetical protein BKA70DRAFT_1236535 [Coprinopsis sp. MPI-PUGE-AT-0042]|nr:hypothetical protein BKA70DRAFT_1236535 [Coprinopsis sp. MPI-PUGE-AT-0042]